MSLLKFLVSKTFFKNLALATVLGFVFVLLTLLFLRIYTRHGQAHPVPDLYGADKAKVEELVKKHKLRYTITDSVYLLNRPRGTVVNQNPKPGFKVKKNRTIHLVFNAVNTPKEKIPKLQDVTYRQAVANLEMLGFQIGHIKYVSGPHENLIKHAEHEGRIIEEGDTLNKGSEIDLFVMNGYRAELTVVPDLVGMDMLEADEKLVAAYLNVGTVRYDTTIHSALDSANAIIYKQRPKFENKLIQGSSVDLYFTLDEEKVKKKNTTSAP